MTDQSGSEVVELLRRVEANQQRVLAAQQEHVALARASMSPTVLALTGFIAWTLSLLVVMESIRARLARAHANCLEGLRRDLDVPAARGLIGGDNV